jgi:hypothetical protein
LEEQTLKNPVLIASINRSKELIYGWQDFKMALWYKMSIDAIEAIAF